MRDPAIVLTVVFWTMGIVLFFLFLVVVFNLPIFPSKKLKSYRFADVEIGGIFYDFAQGGIDDCTDGHLLKFKKISKFQAKCLDLSGNPISSFGDMDLIKVNVI